MPELTSTEAINHVMDGMSEVEKALDASAVEAELKADPNISEFDDFEIALDTPDDDTIEVVVNLYRNDRFIGHVIYGRYKKRRRVIH